MVDHLVNSSLNAQRITNVENCFGSSGQPLAVTGRVLVGEGVLTKMCRKKPKPRQFFLFNDILVYGNIVINKKKYNKQHIIPLEEVKLENLTDDDVMKNGWLIRTPTKSFAVYAATATEKSEWMAHINKCLEELLNKTGKKPSTEHAAVWVPDAEANTCMHCRKAQFSFINRRHHCRKCGAVVCGMCSNKKFLLPSQSTKPLRVCLSCYDTLSKARVDFPPEPQKVDKPSTTTPQSPLSPATPDSSGDEDSDLEDDDDHDETNPKNVAHGEDVGKDMEQLYIDDKPTFYGDDNEKVNNNENKSTLLSDNEMALNRNQEQPPCTDSNLESMLVTTIENFSSSHREEKTNESSTTTDNQLYSISDITTTTSSTNEGN